MDEPWTLSGLVAEVAKRIAALPAPRNGQVRAVPDERTIRYYGTIGLLDRPSAMRGRTALYGRKHVAQVVAIKRLQTMGRSLSEIQALWPTLDDSTLARMSGIELGPAARAPARAAFWKREPAGNAVPAGATDDAPAAPLDAPGVCRAADPGPLERRSREVQDDGREREALELRIALAPGVVLSLSAGESVAVNPADVRALRAAAAPLLTELASRGLASHSGGQES